MWGTHGTESLGDKAMVMAVMVMTLLLQGTQQQSASLSVANRIKKAKEALQFVELIAKSKDGCPTGTGNTLQLTFDTTAWIPYTDPATRTANFISARLSQLNNSLKSVPDITFYNMVRNNVHGETLIFGSGTAFAEDILPPGRTIFCAYASRNPDGGVTAFDLAESYNYVNSSAVWWVGPKSQDYSGVKIVRDIVNVTAHKQVEYRQPVANYSHGFWTQPYFDCGGGNIWMVTFCAPVLALDSNDTPIFKGIASSDLELTNIDINQCDDDDDEAGSLDVFRGTHNCQPTTKCVPISNQGFMRGSYNCECIDGYYFPATDSPLKAFRGVDIDRFFDKDNDTDAAIVAKRAAKQFQCLRCPRGCEICVDDTPCLYQNSIAVRLLIVVIVLLLVCFCGFLSFFTFKYKAELVMKTASPSFLQIMILGAVLMCVSVLVMYPEPTELLCVIFVWPFHLGISLLYGSLLLKTWRISVIFNSRRKVNLTDKVLLQRLAFLPAVMALTLAAWTVVKPPHVVTVVMPDDKKFFSCSFDYWNYSVFGAEALMLLFGVYLSFSVRKAPAQFNESKYITWSIYNAIIMGVFIITITQMMAATAGPDVLYVLLMLQVQVFDTIALALIFAPKMWTLHRGMPPDHGVTVMGAGNVGVRPTAITTRTSIMPPLKHKAVQVTPDDLPPCPSDVFFTAASQGRPSSGLRSNRVAPMDTLSAPALLNQQNSLGGVDKPSEQILMVVDRGSPPQYLDLPDKNSAHIAHSDCDNDGVSELNS